MSFRRTILIVGQASQKTGLARVTRAIADHLAPHEDVHVLGIDCRDPRIARTGWTLHSNPSELDLYAEARLTELVDEIRPSVVLLYNDLWVIPRYFPSLESARHRPAVAAYCPIDGPIRNAQFAARLERVDAVAVFTQFARAEMPFRSVHVIPHGVDTKSFHPWTDRAAARRALFPDRPELWDGFWVLNANRNQPRKRLDLTLQGFARFAENKPASVRLYLHCGLTDIGVDLMREAARLGIEDRLLFSQRTDDHPSTPTFTLNAIYNACDVGVNTATGEGWGLISCEHAATRAAQIVPRHSACAEIWEGAAELLPVSPTHTNDVFEGGVIDPADLAESLERHYADRAYCDSQARAAYQRITRPEYGWAHVADQWRALFDNINIHSLQEALP